MLRIKELLKERKMTAKELAAKMEMTETGLSLIVKGKTSPSLNTLTKIADMLNVPVAELFAPQSDFIAFVRRHGETRTFESEAALVDYAATLSGGSDKP